MVDLSSSRWAPISRRQNNFQAPPNQQTYHSLVSSLNGIADQAATTAIPQASHKLSKQQRDLVTRRSDAIKLTKLSRRLKWKGRTLLYSYHRALHERDHNLIGGVAFPMPQGEAEMMFKIDFFEYYVLLERVLVHLLGVFGLIITAAYGSSIVKPDGDGLRKEKEPYHVQQPIPSTAATASDSSTTKPTEPKSLREQLLEQHHAQRSIFGDSAVFHGYSHRFHANVLAALDHPSNPLHNLLGTGPVRDYLGIAKEFRNRWKDAEEKPADESEDGLVGSKYEKMLQDFKLDEMLGAVLVAIESALPLADEELTRFQGTVVGGEGGDRGLEEAMMELDGGDARDRDMPWEAMPDAMDWD